MQKLSLYTIALVLVGTLLACQPEPAHELAQDNVNPAVSQAAEEAFADAAVAAMQQQLVAWNAGDLEAFMAPYWRSDSLLFMGSGGYKMGWDATLENYQKNYPDDAARGELSFEYDFIELLAPGVGKMVGRFYLAYPQKDTVDGHFTLLWQQKNGQWVITHDHSSD